MQNRIASLFALDELLGAKTNGHNGNGHASKRRRRKLHKRSPNAPHQSKPASPRSAYPTSKRPRKALAQSFDTGAPIRCEHGVAYTPVEQVQVPSESAPGGVAMSFDVGDGYTVEAFEEEEEEDLLGELPDLEDDESFDNDYSAESARSLSYEESVPRAPRSYERSYERRLPEAFAAQMARWSKTWPISPRACSSPLRHRRRARRRRMRSKAHP